MHVYEIIKHKTNIFELHHVFPSYELVHVGFYYKQAKYYTYAHIIIL